MNATSGFDMYWRAQRGRLDLLLPADLADHHDHVGVVVVLELLQDRLEVGAVHRVAADPDARRLAQPEPVIWRHGLVVERAGARHDADPSLRVDVATA